MAIAVTKTYQNFSPGLGVAIIYFFLNCLFLPEGLQYTTLLTPLFLWWLWQEKYQRFFIAFFIITLLYAIIHFSLGVQAYYYLRSWFLAFCSFTFALAIHRFLKKSNQIEYIFEKIAIINIVLVPVAIVALWLPPLNEYFWYYKPISPGVKSFPRLSMLTYEASYYSLLFAPVVLYYLLLLIYNKPGRPFLLLIALATPMLLSLSFGVIGAIAITTFIIMLIQGKNIFLARKNSKWILFSGAAIMVIIVTALMMYPDNPVSKRINNVFHNKDTSIRGRTYEAFHLARWIASEKSTIFGVGFGQIKVIGHDIIINYYKYYEPHPVVRIPNSLAETLAMFGITGLILRFILEIFLFVRTRVYSNVYRLAIFIFVFIYQFTGSFMFNIITGIVGNSFYSFVS